MVLTQSQLNEFIGLSIKITKAVEIIINTSNDLLQGKDIDGRRLAQSPEQLERFRKVFNDRFFRFLETFTDDELSIWVNTHKTINRGQIIAQRSLEINRQMGALSSDLDDIVRSMKKIASASNRLIERPQIISGAIKKKLKILGSVGSSKIHKRPKMNLKK